MWKKKTKNTEFFFTFFLTWSDRIIKSIDRLVVVKLNEQCTTNNNDHMAVAFIVTDCYLRISSETQKQKNFIRLWKGSFFFLYLLLLHYAPYWLWRACNFFVYFFFFISDSRKHFCTRWKLHLDIVFIGHSIFITPLNSRFNRIHFVGKISNAFSDYIHSKYFYNCRPEHCQSESKSVKNSNLSIVQVLCGPIDSCFCCCVICSIFGQFGCLFGKWIWKEIKIKQDRMTSNKPIFWQII